MPPAQPHGADLLPLEGKVRGKGNWGRQETEATGGGKPEAEACGGRAQAGQPGIERRTCKKLLEPVGLRAAVSYVQVEHRMSERHACRLVGLARSTNGYRAGKGERDAALRTRLKELAAKRMRFGYRRLTAMRLREGMAVKHKRVYRLYREERLARRVRRRRRIRGSGVATNPAASRPNERWSMDFVSDCVSRGKVIRRLTIVDDCTRE
jgi:putative transposase